VIKPPILESEDGRFWDGSGDGGFERDVVRGDAHAGSQGGVGEGGAKGGVDKGAIKASKSRALTLVTLGEGVVKEREFHEHEGVDRFIEASSECVVEAGGVLISSSASEVIFVCFCPWLRHNTHPRGQGVATTRMRSRVV
jgi:hypothetical protein